MTSLAIHALATSLVLAALTGTAAADANTLKPLMDQIIADGAPGVVVLSRSGDDETILAAGNASLTPETSLAASDRMRMGSIAKTFVSVVVLQLAQAGRIDLDQPIETYLPGVLPDGQAATVRQLLNHTSGIFDYWQDESFLGQLMGDPAQVWPPRALVDIATAHAPAFGAGASWAYSNTNYILLGLLIESVTGNTLAQEIDTRILRPMALDETTFDASPHMAGTYAHGYADLGEAVPVDVTLVDPSAAWSAGGGLVSTARDIADFYAGLMDGALLEPGLLEQMMTTVHARDGLDYGLGIAEIDLSCGTAWGHRGEFPGYLSFAVTSADGERQAVVLTNYYSLSEQGRAAFDDLIDEALCG